jgi:hypothetical protein
MAESNQAPSIPMRNHQRHDLRRQSAAIISHHQQSRTLMASIISNHAP